MTIRATVEAAFIPSRPLGEVFVGRGLITEAELETALAEQVVTGKRLGEILVERDLVSEPELTAALMDQLGVGIAREAGFGSGLWAEIKRRHKRGRHDEAEPEEDREEEPEILLVPRIDYKPLSEQEPEPNAAEQLEPVEPEPEVEFEPDPEPEFELELEPEPEFEFELETEPEFEPEPEIAHEPEVERAPVAGSGEAAALRAELDAAHTDVARLQDMLADARSALAALSAEAAGEPFAAVE